MDTLYTYFRSSAAYRVRIALALKNLTYRSVPVHLLNQGGEQRLPAYTALNPQQLVPAWQTADGAVLAQSLAIIEYLEETHPEPPLLPDDPLQRARVRAFAQHIACDIHPLNNTRVLQYLVQQGWDDAHKQAWYAHWVHKGFTALEASLSDSGAYCFGDTPTLADCCLIPQVYNARRFQIDLSAYPRICRIAETAARHPAFIQAAPEQQSDAP
ncbi:maleylacetoacetate isomerase [Neisseria shayeganii]|uniref:Maleylacetoacetate isomerase n=1 Tax=Neisseria shayeganii TaxID=607712 RepID=A0A7D7N589_9NEIS|nr:maleylacetoacetate isomerase [Neisseria shayeganii]QMT40420.1 maleylacetoacetate isomerase [Neisseria shayeganii]